MTKATLLQLCSLQERLIASYEERDQSANKLIQFYARRLAEIHILVHDRGPGLRMNDDAKVRSVQQILAAE